MVMAKSKKDKKESGHFYKFLGALTKFVFFYTCSFIRILLETFLCLFSLCPFPARKGLHESSWYLLNTPTLHLELKLVRPILPYTEEIRRCECTDYSNAIHISCTTSLSRNFIAFEKNSTPSIGAQERPLGDNMKHHVASLLLR